MDVKDNFQALSDDELMGISGGTYSGPCFVYVIQRGDCISVIAQRYGTTVKELCDLNNIKNPNLLYAGHKLLVPYKAPQ